MRFTHGARGRVLAALALVHSALAVMALAVFLAALPVDARAQDCAPKTWRTPLGSGTPVIEYANGDGTALRWWCPAPNPADGWLLTGGITCLKADCQRGMADAFWRVVTAGDAWAQTKAELAAAQRVPAPGTAEACAWQRLKREACIHARTTPLGLGYPVAVSAAEAAQRCPAEPVCTAPPPAGQYLTPPGGSAIYAVTNGKVGLPTGRRAAGSALCDCSTVRLSSGGYTYCPLAGGPATEVVLAIKQP